MGKRVRRARGETLDEAASSRRPRFFALSLIRARTRVSSLPTATTDAPLLLFFFPLCAKRAVNLEFRREKKKKKKSERAATSMLARERFLCRVCAI